MPARTQDEEEKKRAEAAAKKAEAKRLLEEEEKNLKVRGETSDFMSRRMPGSAVGARDMFTFVFTLPTHVHTNDSKLRAVRAGGCACIGMIMYARTLPIRAPTHPFAHITHHRARLR